MAPPAEAFFGFLEARISFFNLMEGKKVLRPLFQPVYKSNMDFIFQAFFRSSAFLVFQ